MGVAVPVDISMRQCTDTPRKDDATVLVSTRSGRVVKPPLKLDL